MTRPSWFHQPYDKLGVMCSCIGCLYRTFICFCGASPLAWDASGRRLPAPIADGLNPSAVPIEREISVCVHFESSRWTQTDISWAMGYFRNGGRSDSCYLWSSALD